MGYSENGRKRGDEIKKKLFLPPQKNLYKLNMNKSNSLRISLEYSFKEMYTNNKMNSDGS